MFSHLLSVGVHQGCCPAAPGNGEGHSTQGQLRRCPASAPNPPCCCPAGPALEGLSLFVMLSALLRAFKIRERAATGSSSTNACRSRYRVALQSLNLPRVQPAQQKPGLKMKHALIERERRRDGSMQHTIARFRQEQTVAAALCQTKTRPATIARGTSFACRYRGQSRDQRHCGNDRERFEGAHRC